LFKKFKIKNQNIDSNDFNVEISNKKEFGDLSSNVALIFCKLFKVSPLDLAEKISNELRKNTNILKIEVLPPGFINFFFKADFWHEQLNYFFNNKDKFNYNINSKSICVEFVSANPTGLMHIGHARGAVLGDTISSILEEVGHNVTREYYINDAGEQIKILNKTIEFHFINNLNKTKNLIPEDLYPGSYLEEITKKMVKKLQLKSLNDLKKNNNQIVKFILDDIKKDLIDLKVFHDCFRSEKKIASNFKIDKLIQKLLANDLAFYGFQEKPKGVNDDNWKSEKQLLFNSKRFGDDADRALLKPNGEITYFMTDILYHLDKIDRKFDTLVNIWGADHFGYVKRLKGAINNLSKKKFSFEIKLTSLVNLIKNKQKVKMSKRSGNYITMREVLKEVGIDNLRFMMISRNADKSIDFDFESVIKKNKDNPVFYVQYAHARCMSILNSYNFRLEDLSQNFNELSNLNLDEEKMLIKYLCSFFNVIALSAIYFEPHRITNFLYDLAKIFHNYWGVGNLEKEKRIISDNQEITKARLMLTYSVSEVIKKALGILKIKCPDQM
jgi:arginyl-tRNA synthetase